MLSKPVPIPHYALSTGEKDRERLTILNEIYNPNTLSLCDIRPNQRILTLGCGIGLLELEMARKAGPQGEVLATDLDAAQLAIAEQYRKEANLQNLRFLQMDISDIDRIPGLFDRIQSRFVLTHLPWARVPPILPMLYDKLAPGGFLLLEEVYALDSLRCEPSDPGYEKWKVLVKKQYAAQKSDACPGKKILAFLQNGNYSVSHTVQQYPMRTTREKKMCSLSVRSSAERLLIEGLVTPQEIEEALVLLERLEQNPAVVPYCNQILQIIVRKV